MLRLALVAATALLVVAQAQAAPRRHAKPRAPHAMVLNLTIDQRGTTRDPHPPAGDAGDVFTTTLLLSNTSAALNKPARASVGAMTFQYVLHGTCSTESCAGATADIVAVSRLPGGTITASDKGVKLGHPPIVVRIVKGTGIFRGVKGTLTVGAESRPVNTYRMTLP